MQDLDAKYKKKNTFETSISQGVFGILNCTKSPLKTSTAKNGIGIKSFLQPICKTPKMLKERKESSSPCADSLLPLKSKAKYFGPDLNRTDGASSVKNGQLYIAVRKEGVGRA